MGQVDTFQIVPDNYNAAIQNLQWADIIPDFQLPSGKIWVAKKGDTWSKELAFRKGVTHLSKYDIVNESNETVQALMAARKTYDEVPNTAELMGLPQAGPDEWAGVFPNSWNKLYFPNGYLTYEQGYEKGMQTSIGHALKLPQVMENTTYTNPDAAMWAGFYEAFKMRMDEHHGPGNWLSCRDYLYSNMAPDIYSLSEAQAKAYVRSPNTLPAYPTITTGTGKYHNLHTIPMYLGGPDWDRRQFYKIAYDGLIHKAIGHKCVVFPFPLHEWRPNNYSGHKMPEGTLFRQDKFPMSFPLSIGMSIFSLAYCDGLIPWGHSTKVAKKEWAPGYMGDNPFWVKTGEAFTAHQPIGTWPHFSAGQYTYTIGTFTGAEDGWHLGAYAFTATLGRTAGGVRKWASYKVGNGNWYNPVNQYADDEVVACKNNLPFMITEVKDGLMSFMYCDPQGSNQAKQVTFVGQNGQQYYFEVCGSMPHIGLISI